MELLKQIKGLEEVHKLKEVHDAILREGQHKFLIQLLLHALPVVVVKLHTELFVQLLDLLVVRLKLSQPVVVGDSGVLNHLVEVLRQEKRQKNALEQIGEQVHGHERVCVAINEADDSNEALEAFVALFAVAVILSVFLALAPGPAALFQRQVYLAECLGIVFNCLQDVLEQQVLQVRQGYFLIPLVLSGHVQTLHPEFAGQALLVAIFVN